MYKQSLNMKTHVLLQMKTAGVCLWPHQSPRFDTALCKSSLASWSEADIHIMLTVFVDIRMEVTMMATAKWLRISHKRKEGADTF